MISVLALFISLFLTASILLKIQALKTLCLLLWSAVLINFFNNTVKDFEKIYLQSAATVIFIGFLLAIDKKKQHLTKNRFFLYSLKNNYRDKEKVYKECSLFAKCSKFIYCFSTVFRLAYRKWFKLWAGKQILFIS